MLDSRCEMSVSVQFSLHLHPSTAPPLLSTSLLLLYSLPSSPPPILPSLISLPSSMTAVVLEVLQVRTPAGHRQSSAPINAGIVKAGERSLVLIVECYFGAL